MMLSTKGAVSVGLRQRHIRPGGEPSLFVPTKIISRIAGPDNPLAVPVAAIIGIPIYIRAETMIPIGALPSRRRE
ncbi:MAG TPA: hypothetical protein VLB04_11205 [Methanotrichaceae archaeon]|nr:hypothetical protein [Methanotrichaceae archaeon]